LPENGAATVDNLAADLRFRPNRKLGGL